MSNLSLVIQREYLERVRKKSFIITTILMPVLMLVLMFAPVMIMMFNKPDHNVIGVIDNSGKIYEQLKSTSLYDFVILDEPADSAIAHQTINGYIVIPADILDAPSSNIRLLMNGAVPVELESNLKEHISSIVENKRLLGYNIENLPEILEKVKANINITEVRLDKEEGESLSSSVSFIISIIMAFILYMFLLMYGQMVMTSIIEEKNNRVLELVVSSVKPMQLMMGKIAGIGLVAITQIVLWGVILGVVAALVMPAVLPADMMNLIVEQRTHGLDPSMIDNYDMINSISTLSSVSYIITMFVWLILFLIGGFLLYASMFAAVGSSVDNVQDASQLNGFILMPIILAFVFTTSIANAPNSTLAIWLSMIPFTSPMIMMARISFGIDMWQIWVSLAILYASFIGMVWVAGKIYRIGIFMYGKKPNIKDLAKWIRYK